MTPERKPEGVRAGSWSQAVLPGASGQKKPFWSPTDTRGVCLGLWEESSPNTSVNCWRTSSGKVPVSASSKVDTNWEIS